MTYHAPTMRRVCTGLLALAWGTAFVGGAEASEGGGGHYISGAFATPKAGIVPWDPGLYWSSAPLYYYASASRGLNLPVAGEIRAGLDVDFASLSYSAIWVPKLDMGNFTYAMGLTIPVQYMRARAYAGPIRDTDKDFNPGDIIITPAMLGYRSGTNFFQARLDIFAPTGLYDGSSLANVSMGYWTFTPTVAYTYLHPSSGLDLSFNLGLDINTRNAKTDYTSGAILHLDASASIDVAKGLGIGVAGSALKQITDDEGGLADRLGGFRGRVFSAGPMARYAFKLGETEINASS
ncbi:transporter [Roseomonas sp. ACRSG]|nr:transporter [Roseomonas sp. ACRSG]